MKESVLKEVYKKVNKKKEKYTLFPSFHCTAILTKAILFPSLHWAEILIKTFYFPHVVRDDSRTFKSIPLPEN